MSLELLLQPRPGVALVLATVPQPALRPARAPAAAVDIYLGYADDEFGRAQLLGTVRPGTTLVREYEPDRDRDLRLHQIPRAADGTPAVGQLLDADTVELPVNRMVDIPVIDQPYLAANTSIGLSIPRNRYARRVKVEVSPHSDMSAADVTEVDLTGDSQLSGIQLNRDPAAGTLTRYVRVSFSAGGDYGPSSAIKTVTFADLGGSGGSGGSGAIPGMLTPVTVS
jgi:hypothetical protein